MPRMVSPHRASGRLRATKGRDLTFSRQSSCVRWCGPPAAVTAALVDTALRVAAGWTGGTGARPWLLSSSDLAPNHWFSTPVEKPCGETTWG